MTASTRGAAHQPQQQQQRHRAQRGRHATAASRSASAARPSCCLFLRFASSAAALCCPTKTENACPSCRAPLRRKRLEYGSRSAPRVLGQLSAFRARSLVHSLAALAADTSLVSLVVRAAARTFSSLVSNHVGTRQAPCRRFVCALSLVSHRLLAPSSSLVGWSVDWAIGLD